MTAGTVPVLVHSLHKFTAGITPHGLLEVLIAFSNASSDASNVSDSKS